MLEGVFSYEVGIRHFILAEGIFWVKVRVTPRAYSRKLQLLLITLNMV